MVFIWMIFTILPWTSWIPSLGDSEGWSIVSSFFFRNVLFGEWYFMQFTILFTITTIVIAKMFRYNTKQTFDVFKTAVNDMMGVAIVLIFTRIISTVLTYSGLTIQMVNTLFPSGGEENPFMLLVIILPLFLLLAIFIPSTSGLAAITGPIIGEIINTSTSNTLLLTIVLMVYPLAQGVINMCSPTTGLILVQAETSKVNFSKSLPYLCAYAGTILIVGLAIILTIIGIEY